MRLCNILILSFLALCSALYTPPSEVYIGGQFETFFNAQVGNGLNRFGSQHVAAFLMAVDEINNKADNINDHLLPHTKLKFVLSTGPSFSSSIQNPYFDGGAASYFLYLSADTELLGVVGTSSDESTVSSLQIFSGWAVPQITTNSTSPDISHGDSFPFNLRMPPSDTFQAILIARMISQQYDWSKVAVLFSTDTFGLDCNTNFFTEAAALGLQVLTNINFPVSVQDYSTEISMVKASGAKIFVVFMNAACTGQLLKQGVEMGLFVEGTQVIGTSAASGPEVWANIPDARNALRGYIALVAAPDLFLQTVSGSQFLNRFRSLKPTIRRNPTTNALTCDNRTDDSIENFLYLVTGNRPVYSITSSNGTGTICVGVESFTTLGTDPSVRNLDPKIAYTYDAVHVMVRGIQKLIDMEVNVTSSALHDVLLSLDDIDYYTATGQSTFSQGDPTNEFLNRGDRQNSVAYVIKNFNPESYVASGGARGMENVGFYMDNLGFQFCDSTGSTGISIVPDQCKAVQYRTVDNKPPADAPPPILTNLSERNQNIWLALAVILFVSVLFFAAVIIKYWNHKVIKNAQPKILLLILLGTLYGAIYLFLSGLDVTHGICSAQAWMIHLSFQTVFLPLELKLWRLDKLVNATALKRVKISEEKIVGIYCISLLILLIILAIKSAVGDYEVVYSAYTVNNQEYRRLMCSGARSETGMVLQNLLVISEACYLLSGLYFLWRTRSVPASINEVSLIAPALLSCVIIIVTLGIVQLTANLGPHAMVIMTNSGVAGILYMGNAVYFKNKLQILYKSIYETEASTSTSGGHSGGSGQATHHQVISLNKEDMKGVSDCKESRKFVQDMLGKKKSYEDRLQLCDEQIKLWTYVLSRLDDEDESGHTNAAAVAPA